MRFLTKSRMPLTELIGLGLLAGVCIFWIIRSYNFPPHDFSNSYFGAYFFLKGEFDPTIFDPYSFNKKIYEEGFLHIFASYNPNPPFAAIFFAPFTWLSLPCAKMAFNTLSAALFIFSVYRLYRAFGNGQSIILIMLPLIFFIPIRNQILFGQTYFLICVLLIEGFLAYGARKTWAASLLWSIAILLKVFPVVILLFLFLNREWKMAARLSIVSLALLLLSVAIIGIESWSGYFLEILPRSQRGEITGPFVANYQSALMLFKYLFVGDPILNRDPFVDNAFLFTFCHVAFNAVILSFCSVIVLKDRNALGFGTIFLASILISPYGSTYGLLVLVILFTSIGRKSQTAMILISLLLFTICNLPVNVFSDLHPVLRFPRLLLLITLGISILLLTKSTTQWKFLVGFLVLFGLPAAVRQINGQEKQSKLIAGQKHSLIVGYEADKGYLTYTYWSDDGPQSHATDIPLTSLTTEKMALKNNQIFFEGNQITTSSDTKLEPALMNGNLIIYLSDQDRGPGFYNLRTIDVGTVTN